jgi:cytochrome c biogenesis protein ResB
VEVYDTAGQAVVLVLLRLLLSACICRRVWQDVMQLRVHLQTVHPHDQHQQQ